MGWGQSLAGGDEGNAGIFPGLCSLDEHPCCLFLQWPGPCTSEMVSGALSKNQDCSTHPTTSLE